LPVAGDPPLAVAGTEVSGTAAGAAGAAEPGVDQQQPRGRQQRRLAGLASGHEWQSKCQTLAEKVKVALRDVPAPSGAYKIASLLKSGALTGAAVLPACTAAAVDTCRHLCPCAHVIGGVTRTSCDRRCHTRLM
jgi:hypothetical protein